MLTLLIQTVFPQAGVALWNSKSADKTLSVEKTGASVTAVNRGVFKLEWLSQKDELQTLLPNIEKLLTKAGGAWSDVGEILIVVGVGNFSATRISVTMANMLGLVTGAKLYEIKLTGEISLDDLIKKVRTKITLKPVKLAKPVYKSAPVISQSRKKSFTG